MASIHDNFVDSMERRQKQLENVVDLYKMLRECLDALPEGMAAEVKQMLLSELKDKRQTESEPVVASDHQEQDLAGKTALECAETILNDHENDPLHFSTIAKEALRRGYKGRVEGSHDEIENTTIKSFWAAMSRSEELEAVGKGMYRLKNWLRIQPQEPSSDEEETLFNTRTRITLSPQRITQGDAAEKALSAASHPLRMSEIVAFVIERGFFREPAGKLAKRHFSNAVWAAMARDPQDRFVKVARGLWGLKRWEDARERQA